MNPNSTAFGDKLTRFQEHAMATYQKYLDNEAAVEAAVEKVIEDPQQMFEVTVYACKNNLLELSFLEVIERFVREPR